MRHFLSHIEQYDLYFVFGVLVFFGLIETIAGHLRASKRTFNDWIQEAGSMAILSLAIKPGILLGIVKTGELVYPEADSLLSSWSLWIALPVYLFIDDVLQYWYHRSAHEYPFLWKLHRPHHQAEEMGFFVSYRNAALYYLLMPNIWWMSLFTFFGGGLAVAIGLILKQIVIVSSHSTVQWDKPLYRIPVVKNIMSVIERIIITPAFHHAHHGKSQADGVSDPNGNYGNMFSIWDQLFGSALYTRQFPIDYGLPNDPKENWTAPMFYPFVKSDDPNSELSKGYKKESTATLSPTTVKIEKDKKYLWCQCGMSKDQPFCDGSHHGTKHRPLLLEAAKDTRVSLCNCKLTQAPPFCDGSHKMM